MRPAGISEAAVRPTGVAEVHLIMVGSDGADGGIPVAVVPDASVIPLSARQNLAARVGVSDTVFVDGAVGDMLTVSAFHPSRVSHAAGPAHIAAAWFHWARQRAPLRPVRCRIPSGIVPVGLAADGVLGLRFPVAAISAPEQTPAFQAVLSRIGCGPVSHPAMADNGSRFLLVTVDEAAAIEAIAENPTLLADCCAEANLQGVCAVYPDDTGITVFDGAQGRSVAARFLSPASIPASSLAAVAALAQWVSKTRTAAATDEGEEAGGDVITVRQDPSTPASRVCHLRADIRREAGGSAPTAIDVGGYCHHTLATSFSW